MAKFKIEKGGSFKVDKGIQHVRLGLGWKEGKLSKPVDVDAHAFGCVNLNGTPTFYNDASHALTYANKGALKRGAGKAFGTHDDSMQHTGDNLTGAGDGDDETILIFLDKLPPEINEIMIFLTIHEAAERGQHFGQVEDSYVVMYNDDSKEELVRYNLRNEFDGAITIQIGSLTKKGEDWTFNAVGAGTPTESLEDVLGKLS